MIHDTDKSSAASNTSRMCFLSATTIASSMNLSSGCWSREPSNRRFTLLRIRYGNNSSCQYIDTHRQIDRQTRTDTQTHSKMSISTPHSQLGRRLQDGRVVCGRGVGSNSIQCTSCYKWLHKKCSGIKGSMYKLMRSFHCRGCSNPVISTGHTSVDIGASANLEVVDKFCYLGDMMCVDGNWKLIKIGWWWGWWVGECFFWYRLTRVVPDKRP